MSDPNDLNLDAPSDLQDIPDASMALLPPPAGTYPDKETLMNVVHAHSKAHHYNVVVKTSSMPTQDKPRRTHKIWLRCDRGGSYRARNGLTEETRKRRRTSRLMDCPFQLTATKMEDGQWKLDINNPNHNHGPSLDRPRQAPQHKVRKGQLQAAPYDWPHDASFSPYTTGLVIVDMQRDFCDAAGYMAFQGHDIAAAQNLIPKIARLLDIFRRAQFPVYFTREGHRPDLSTLSRREQFRSHNGSQLGIGDQGPLGRLLVRGQPGWNIVDELQPLENEPVIDKPGRGAFAHTDFELILRNKGIKNLVIVGVTTDVCVSTTMREANDRGFDCLILHDGTAAAEQALHTSTIESVKMEGGIFGAVSNVDTVVHALETFKAAAEKKLATQVAS
ncbi:isochorismatase family hydrolase [Penicillium herquei]|nr:isochorismatase family hydrolase [Penicillium herquei]